MDIGTKFDITGIFQGGFSDFASQVFYLFLVVRIACQYLKMLTLFKT